MALSNFSFCAASLGPKMPRLGLFLPLKTAMTIKPRPSELVLAQEQDRDAAVAQGMMPGALMLHSSLGTAWGQPWDSLGTARSSHWRSSGCATTRLRMAVSAE